MEQVYRGYRSLGIAVFIQAIKDINSVTHAEEVEEFLRSDGFVWLWSEVSEDIAGLPDIEAVRHRILSGKIAPLRFAYHKTQVSPNTCSLYGG